MNQLVELCCWWPETVGSKLATGVGMRAHRSLSGSLLGFVGLNLCICNAKYECLERFGKARGAGPTTDKTVHPEQLARVIFG